MTIDLTPILQAAIALLAALVISRLIPWLNSRMTDDQLARTRAAVKVAVFAAEQLYGAGKGAEKLDYALNWLRNQGYDVNRAEIEAAVWQHMKQIEVLGLTQDETESPG